MRNDPFRSQVKVLGSPIDSIDWPAALGRLVGWARARESRYVCICNAHSLVTASQDPSFRQVIANSDMATPDGAPVAWMMRRLGFQDQERISGPDLMLRLCERVAQERIPIYLLGSTTDTLEKLQVMLLGRMPSLLIAGVDSPPFGPPSVLEDESLISRINNAEPGIVFVSLGCPKQERWMASHRDRIEAVLIGVGAAFDFHAGVVRRAPMWMQMHGLEWLHRLGTEPRRLWRRYLYTNIAFIIGATTQLFSRR